jgi:radical SAM superfamily enzyme YgiQ (UPF0313 family)
MSNNQVVLFGDSPPGHSRPVAIHVLASFLRKHNITVQPVWGFSYVSYHTFSQLCQKFLNEHVKVVGISATLIANRTTHDFFGCTPDELSRRLALIKQLAPNAKIAVGGSQVTYDALPTGPGTEMIDLYIKGQGEQALLELATATKPLKTESILPPTVSDKMYPHVEFSTTPTVYEVGDGIIEGEGLAMEFARGCIFKCSFCSYALTGKKYGDYTKAKNTLIYELLYNYHTHGTTHYYVTDDMINDSEEKVDMILEVSRALPFRLQYTAFMRLDMIRRFPSMAAKLRDSGLIGAFFGIETIDHASGRKVGKGLGLERINEAVDICNEAWQGQVYGQGSFILGLPGHTTDIKDELLTWLDTPSVKKLIKYITMYPLYIIPGLGLSEIDQNPAQFGYSEDPDNERNPAIRYNYSYLNWKTDTYTFSQAFDDADYVKTQFLAARKYLGIKHGGIFRLPYLLSLSDRKEEMLDLLLNDESTAWPTNEDWKKYLAQIEFNYRSRYINLMLSK